MRLTQPQVELELVKTWAEKKIVLSDRVSRLGFTDVSNISDYSLRHVENLCENLTAAKEPEYGDGCIICSSSRSCCAGRFGDSLCCTSGEEEEGERAAEIKI